jgi:hypothetical protein
MKLHPVTFIYKSDPQGVKQYGLVAEEVEQVYPELVVHDDAGRVETVRYSMLTSMLLNELQKQNRKNEQQAERIDQQAKRIDQLSQQIEAQKASTEQQVAREAVQHLALEERFARLERTIVAQHEGVKVEAAFNP